MRANSLLPPALALAGSLLLCAAAYGQGAPLFAIATDTASSEPVAAGEPLRVALYARELPRLADVLGAPPPAPGADRLEYLVASYPQLAAGVDRSWLEPTFMIDFLEADTVRARDELFEAKGERPSRPQLVEFVAAAVKATPGRSWDFASTVARRREGDCTEFAVLTAALARAAKIPARVVVGMAIVSEDRRFGTYGHAWAELLEGGRWVVADAALHGATATIRYVPYGVLTDEGPGYALGLARLSTVWVERVVVLGPQRRTAN